MQDRLLFGRIKVKYAVVALGAAVLVILSLMIARGVYVQINPITISKVPGDSKLFINDKETTGDRANLPNGTYKIRAEKDGFSSYSGTVIIDDYNKYIGIALEPSSEAAVKWAEENQSLYTDQESTGGAALGEAGKSFADANPIVEVLPIEGYTYTVGYKLDTRDTSGKSIILTIDTSDGYRNAALSSIYNIGFDPADFIIDFKDYTNPFKESTDAITP